MTFRSLQRALGVTTAVAFCVALTAPRAQAQLVSRQQYTVYQASGLSLWPAGSSSSGTLPSILIGPSWTAKDKTIGDIADLVIPAINFGLFTTPEVNLGKTGATITFGGSGELGLKMAPAYKDGTFDLYYQGGVSLTFNRYPAPGAQTTVNAAFTGGGGSYFKTYTPKFGLKVWSDFRADGHASSVGYFLDDKLWDGNIFTPFSVGGAPKLIGQINDFSDPTQINQLVSNLNPTPIGASMYAPDISTESTSVNGDGTIQQSKFSKFLTAETDALSWIALLFGDYGPLLSPLSGDYTIPGTGLDVTWDFCKAFANFDVGYIGDYKVTPVPQISLKVYNGSGQLIATGSSSVTFTMPSDRVTVVPTLTTDFQFRNHLAFGVSGSLGITPISITAKGTIGSGKNAQTYDIDFDPATEQWKGDPSATTSVFDQTFTLPWSQADKVRVLPSIGINATNLLDLPREIYAGADTNLVAFIQAYDSQPDKDYYSINVIPEQGRKFFVANATFTAKFQAASGGTITDLAIGHRDDSSVELQIPTSLLVPGQYMITFTDSTKNSQNQPRSASWIVPVTVYYKTPNFDGEMYKQADRDVESATNRIVADGTDHNIYVGVTGIYKDSIVVLNGPNGNIPLKTDITADQDVTGREIIGFTIPARLADELAGQEQTVQIINRNLKTDINGNPLPPLVSTGRSLFFVADKPHVNGLANTKTGGAIPIGDADVWMDLKGSSFTRYSKVYATGIYGGSENTELPFEYSSPTLLHVRFPAEQIKWVHNFQTTSPGIWVNTPQANVPTISSNEPDLVSGGASNTISSKFVYGPPALNREDPSILVRLSDNTVRVYGDNLFRQPTKVNGVLTRFRLDNQDVSVSNISYPSGTGITVPYVDLKIAASSSIVGKVGVRKLQAFNSGPQSLLAFLSCENGAPQVASGQSFNLKVGPGRNNKFSISGGPCYPDTKVYVNGSDVTGPVNNIKSIDALVPASVLLPIDNQTTTATLFNPTPGGGTSGTVKLNLLERDPSKIKIAKGPLTYDRSTDTWTQVLTLTYTGHRILNTNAWLEFQGLPSSVQLVNSTGNDGSPYIQATLGDGSVRVLAKFKRSGFNPISFTPVVHFLD